jgi:V/A-type H+-transporting ATPase subunit F
LFRVRVLCPEKNRRGFALAGVETVSYRDLAEGESHVQSALEETDLGVLLVDETLMSALGPKLSKRVFESPLPLVLPVPMEPGAEVEREYLERVIRRVIGYQIRLQ